MFLIPVLVFGQADKKSFTELNIGVAAIDGYSFDDWFPGASLLFGQTFANDGIVTEYQIGIALPAIATGKLAIGAGDINKNIMFAVRPWPLSLGPQIKLGIFSASFEVGFNNGISFDAGFIATIGWRWQFGGQKKSVL